MVNWQTGSPNSLRRPQETWFCTKLEPPPLTPLRRRNLILLENFPIFCMIFFFFTHFMEEKLSFPVFPRINDESTSKFIQTHSSPQKNKALSFSQLKSKLSLNSLVLCYVSVHFAVLRCSCQIFPLNESFNALLDDYRTREESCSQLLCDLVGHESKKQNQYFAFFILSLSSFSPYLTSFATLCWKNENS